MVVLGGGAVSYERGTPVAGNPPAESRCLPNWRAQIQGYLAHKKTPPPRTVIGPYARAYHLEIGDPT